MTSVRFRTLAMAFAVCATAALFTSTAEAQFRSWRYCPPGYRVATPSGAPVVASPDGRVRYRSGYQAEGDILASPQMSSEPASRRAPAHRMTPQRFQDPARDVRRSLGRPH